LHTTTFLSVTTGHLGTNSPNDFDTLESPQIQTNAKRQGSLYLQEYRQHISNLNHPVALLEENELCEVILIRQHDRHDSLR